MKRAVPLFLMIGGFSTAAACRDATSPNGETIVVSVAPDGGATEVDPDGPITLTFSGPMQGGMENHVAMHRGDAAGPVVPGAWTWSDNRTRLTFSPTSPLDAGTAYTIHLGGGVMDAGGRALGYEHCLDQHGGRWVTDQMMDANGGMMGPGWRHANGSYGMVFTFSTR